MDALKGLHLQACLEAGTHSPEDGLHIHVLVVETMLTLVELDVHSLQGGPRILGHEWGPRCPQYLLINLFLLPRGLAPVWVDDLRESLPCVVRWPLDSYEFWDPKDEVSLNNCGPCEDPMTLSGVEMLACVHGSGCAHLCCI